MLKYNHLLCTVVSSFTLCACAGAPTSPNSANTIQSTAVSAQIADQAVAAVIITPPVAPVVIKPAAVSPQSQPIATASAIKAEAAAKLSAPSAPTRTALATATAIVRNTVRATPPLPSATPIPQTAPQLVPAFAALERRMLELVNNDRHAAGLAAVQWDDFTAGVARTHSQEMANLGYFSHWDAQGYGPDVRYGLAGGSDSSMENIYMFWWRFSDGRPAVITDWDKVVRDAEQALMNSPGHRANILAPEHTHVGIGMVYNASTGDVRIDQVFTNRYTQLSAIPKVARVGQEIDIAGFLINGASNPLVNVAWEPFATPLTVAQLEVKPHSYGPTNIVSQAVLPTVNGSQFTSKVKLDSGGRAGIYHIRVFATVGGRQVLATDTVIQAR